MTYAILISFVAGAVFENWRLNHMAIKRAKELADFYERHGRLPERWR